MIPNVISLWGLKREFQNVTPIVKSVSACARFAYVWGEIKNLFMIVLIFKMFLSCSDHGQPPFDKPSVTDSQWYLSLQHSAGWELHPTLTWRLQLYRLAPHKCSSLCVQSCQNVCIYITYTIHSLLSLCPLLSHTVFTNSLLYLSASTCVCVCVSLFVCCFSTLCSCQTDLQAWTKQSQTVPSLTSHLVRSRVFMKSATNWLEV